MGLLICGARAEAQTLDDGLTIRRREFRLGMEYGHDAWDKYWEGALKRENGNIGTLTTQSVTATAIYGVTDRLTLLAALPYVRTEASQGVLHGMKGRQDLTMAAKFRLVSTTLSTRARLSALVVAGAGMPTSDYTPDFLPLSIGSASRRALTRVALHLQDRSGFFVDGSVGRTWRSKVTLDRPAYFTNGQLFLSNEVEMPGVSDYMLSAGLQRGRLCIPIGISEQRTLGGGDIRRQDMPFVSNRMNFTRMHARVMYTLPTAVPLIVHVGAIETLRGRNVGQSTTIVGGMTYVVGR
ncbi:MAG: hypothetical protein Q8K82_17515 [Gemmatimonadaceae bacterium]|nr:hypothetical protein [Gemmatimonadaceae bacterium]